MIWQQAIFLGNPLFDIACLAETVYDARGGDQIVDDTNAKRIDKNRIGNTGQRAQGMNFRQRVEIGTEAKSRLEFDEKN